MFLRYTLGILPWLILNKSEAGTLAGIKFFIFIGRWLAADFCHTKAIYDYYKSMVWSQTNGKQSFLAELITIF